jgi:hypothetical protein
VVVTVLGETNTKDANSQASRTAEIPRVKRRDAPDLTDDLQPRTLVQRIRMRSYDMIWAVIAGIISGVAVSLALHFVAPAPFPIAAIAFLGSFFVAWVIDALVVAIYFYYPYEDATTSRPLGLPLVQELQIIEEELAIRAWELPKTHSRTDTAIIEFVARTPVELHTHAGWGSGTS